MEYQNVIVNIQFRTSEKKCLLSIPGKIKKKLVI